MKLLNHLRYFLLLVLLSGSTSMAQGPHFTAVDLPAAFDEFDIVFTAQGAGGFMWIATDHGLFRYDGSNFLQHRFDGDSTDNAVTALCTSCADTLWIGYSSGQIATLVDGGLALFNPPEGNPGAKISDIVKDAEGNIWYATYGEGIYVYVPGRNRVYNFNTDDGLSDNYVYCLETDALGRIWAGTDKGINICTFRSEEKRIQHIGSLQGLPDNIITSLQRGSGDLMLAGMYQGGICSINFRTMDVARLFDKGAWSYGAVLEFTVHNDQIWVVTGSRKIVQYVMNTPPYIREYGPEHGLSDDAFEHISKDDEGNLWIVPKTTGLIKVNLLFEIIRNHEGIEFNHIRALLADSKGNIWFFNEAGLVRHSIEFTGRNVVTRYDLQLPEQMQIISLFEDNRGYVWAGTFGDGVYRISPENGAFLHLTKRHGLVDDNILHIAGRGDDLWFATLGGVSHIWSGAVGKSDKLPFTTINDADGLGNSYVYSVHPDKKGNIWFATDGNGLVRRDVNGNYTAFSTRTGHIQSSVVYSIAEDQEGNIWFSTLKEGIYKYDGRSFVNFNISNGLKDLNITGLVTDKKNHLFVAHKNGIDILDTGTGTFSYYSNAYGLQNINPDLNTTSVDIYGDIWLGTSRALIKYSLPDSSLRNRPRTILETPTVFLKPHDFGKDNRLKSRQNYLTFHFVGLWYQNPGAVTYEYHLDGYDIDWVSTRDQSVIYPSLPPGQYRFSVRSSANNSFDDDDVQSFQFSISPPFWKTWWFLGLALCAAVGGGYYFVYAREQRLRNAALKEKEIILLEFENLKSQVNPHFLFNSFNSLISVIEEDRDKAVEYVEKLSQFFRNILSYRDEDLIPLERELEVVRDYFFIHQQRYGSLVTLSVEVPPAALKKLIPPLTLQILIENAIKHNVISKASPLHITVEADEEAATVKNRIARKRNGERSTGTGLENIRNRYRILTDKRIQITEETEYFIVRLPLINPAP